MIIATKSKNQTSGGVEDKLEAPLKTGWKPDQDNIAVVKSPVKRHYERTKAVVGDV